MNPEFIMIVVGILVICICYGRMRDRIPFNERESFERMVMVFLLIVLILNVFLLINRTRIKSSELNDCIRFYRYFPNIQDNEFYFIRETCYKYYDMEKIDELKQSGRIWNKKQSEKGNYFPQLNIGEIE